MPDTHQHSTILLLYASRKKYLVVSCLSMVLGVLLYLCVPHLYSAQVKVADENQRVEMTFHIPNWDWKTLSTLYANSAQEDMEVYPAIVDSRDFLKRMSQVEISNYGITYGEHIARTHNIQPNDSDRVLDVLDDAISYSSSPRYSLVTFQVLDSDPYVAAVMVDSVRVVMQDIIVNYVSSKYEEDLRVAETVVETNRQAYLKALKASAQYAETHKFNNSAEAQSQQLLLQGEVESAKEVYSISSMELARAQAAVKQYAAPFAVLKSATVPHSTSQPMLLGYVLSFWVVGMVLTTWYVLYKRRGRTLPRRGFLSYFAPWSLTCFVWLAIVVMTVVQLQGNILYPVTSQFLICLSIWLPVFVVASVLTYMLLPFSSDSDTACLQQTNLNTTIFRILWIISLVITPMYLYNIMKIVSQFDTADMLYNLRILAVHGDESYGFLNYSFVLNQALFLVAVWRYPRLPLWQLLSIYAVNVMSCFAIMEKGGFFLLVVTTMFVLFQRGVIRMRSIVIGLCVLIVVFFFINFMRAEQTTENTTKDMTFIDFFAMYVLSPPVAFCRLQQDISGQFGSHTFSTIYLFLNRFGGNFEVNTKLQEFVWVPIPTNVYTIFQPFYQDFGYFGIAIFALIYGVASGWVYRAFRSGNPFARSLYSYFVYVLILQFYQENIFLSLVFFTQLTFFIWLIHRVKV